MQHYVRDPVLQRLVLRSVLWLVFRDLIYKFESFSHRYARYWGKRKYALECYNPSILDMVGRKGTTFFQTLEIYFIFLFDSLFFKIRTPMKRYWVGVYEKNVITIRDEVKLCDLRLRSKPIFQLKNCDIRWKQYNKFRLTFEVKDFFNKM